MGRFKELLIVLAICLAIVVIPMLVIIPVSYLECKRYSTVTGYWTKWDITGCYVLLENQYLIDKDKVMSIDRPAFRPEIHTNEELFR